MTPTQIARRSDALYADGTCGMTRRVLCDMVAQRESDLEDARAECAKLRELVRDMWRFTSAACKKYPRLFDPAAQGGQMVQLNAIDAFEQRMRELENEVD